MGRRETEISEPGCKPGITRQALQRHLRPGDASRLDRETLLGPMMRQGSQRHRLQPNGTGVIERCGAAWVWPDRS